MTKKRYRSKLRALAARISTSRDPRIAPFNKEQGNAKSQAEEAQSYRRRR